jgi:hypothetical protein
MADTQVPISMEEVTDPEEVAKAQAQRERFDRNFTWLQAHASEVSDFSVSTLKRPLAQASGGKSMKVFETKRVLNHAFFHHESWEWLAGGQTPAQGGYRAVKPALHSFKPSSPLPKIPDISCTFMGLSPRARINPGRDHRAEKSGYTSATRSDGKTPWVAGPCHGNPPQTACAAWL